MSILQLKFERYMANILIKQFMGLISKQYCMNSNNHSSFKQKNSLELKLYRNYSNNLSTLSDNMEGAHLLLHYLFDQSCLKVPKKSGLGFDLRLKKNKKSCLKVMSQVKSKSGLFFSKVQVQALKF
ncbi:hypothetical protein BpHYR1_035383 [Brachionus plicatilis]|uniref:Uncharacterized protein n=1 Tax=Brachionus plicatilis TaxID=10195 RepID=A0A3M7RLR9_BRAPC|nr:hypothetical protein BpHYR1_035383 [Brachionus plicatilis]